jgi:ATP-dependent DNA helicase PIF1
LEKLAVDKPSPVLRAAPTSITSHNIIGKTLHSLFRLLVKKNDYQTLGRASIQALQSIWKGVKYLIIDEKSMVSLKQLSWIHRRCHEIWPDNPIDMPFASLNIVIVSDFCQLPPVADRALFNTVKEKASADILLAQRLYLQFDKTITLSQVMRQQGTNTEAVAFREALGHLRMNLVTKND